MDSRDRVNLRSSLVLGSCAFAELLSDCDEDRTLRAVLVEMLRKAD
jgi:hypothetical protein